MNKFLISTDNTCDMPADFWAKHTDIIKCILPFTICGKEYTRDEDISAEEYYTLLSEGNMATTSQINQYECNLLFEKAFEAGYDIIHLGLSSGVSACHENFKPTLNTLRAKYPERKFELVDTLNGSGGLGILVSECLRLREEGKSFDETVSYIESILPNIVPMFIVTDLIHLKKSGRLKPIEASIGTLLGIKPILAIDKLGKLRTEGKARGMKKANKILLETTISKIDKNLCDFMVMTHGDDEQAARLVGTKIEEKTGIKVLYVHLTKVIGSHTGKGTIAVFFMGEARYTV